MKSIKGILPPIMAETPKRAIKFFCFGSYNAYLSRNTSLSNAACGSIAGLGSGLTEGFFITPFERVKILLQNQKGSLKGKELIHDSTLMTRFQFRWLNIKGIDAAFPFSIALFSNHLK